MKENLPLILRRLNQLNIRHEVHTFDSGAVMVDIWLNDLFYIIQIWKDQIGLSLVTKETSFDIIPDNSYSDFEIFKEDLERLLQQP